MNKDTVKPLVNQGTEIDYRGYIGIDVHKDTIVVAVALPGRHNASYRCKICNTPKAVDRLLNQMSKEFDGEVLLWGYEAGPCGHGLYRQITAFGHDCQIVAPSLLPKKASDRIKTDRRDAVKLAQSLRSGETTAIWVPDEGHEAIRDLTRARDDMKSMERKARQQLGGFLLRHEKVWPTGKTRWTKGHFNWLEALKFDQPMLQVVLQEYIDTVKQAQQRVVDLTDQMHKVLMNWSMAPVIQALVCLRGIDVLSAMVIVAELGDLRRFESPRQLMAYLGLVPSEHSSGSRRRQGAITRTGNRHARRMLVECAWSYRFPARMTMHLKRKSQSAPVWAKGIGWKAQKRLCTRYRRLIENGKNVKLTCVAIARELAGFIWDIACRQMDKLHPITV